MSIWKIMGLTRSPEGETADQASSTSADAMREVVARLSRLEPKRARYVALFAYILGRVANADLEMSEAETRAMEREIRKRGNVDEAEAVLVVEIAKAQHRLCGATDSYTITREFARAASPEEKIALLECLFAVSAADRDVSGVEENEIRRIVKELDLSHDDFIAARSKHLDYVAVLKQARLPGG